MLSVQWSGEGPGVAFGIALAMACGVDDRPVDVLANTPQPYPFAVGSAGQQNAMPGGAGTSPTGAQQTAGTPFGGSGGAPSSPMAPQVAAPAAAGVGSGGSGGAPSAPAMMVEPGAIPTGVGLALTPLNGWISGTTNEVGVQGYFFTLSDARATPPGSTTITPEDFAASGTSVCVAGVASQVVPGTDGIPAYAQYWGGGVGVTLADPGGGQPLRGWDRGDVVGFSFNVTGATVPPAGQFRFVIQLPQNAGGSGYCANISPGANSIRFEQVVNECWPGGLMSPSVPPTAELRQLEWSVATVTTAATPFDFCIENLTAIVAR